MSFNRITPSKQLSTHAQTGIVLAQDLIEHAARLFETLHNLDELARPDYAAPDEQVLRRGEVWQIQRESVSKLTAMRDELAKLRYEVDILTARDFG